MGEGETHDVSLVLLSFPSRWTFLLQSSDAQPYSLVISILNLSRGYSLDE